MMMQCPPAPLVALGQEWASFGMFYSENDIGILPGSYVIRRYEVDTISAIFHDPGKVLFFPSTACFYKLVKSIA
jgi:hypothetical protein